MNCKLIFCVGLLSVVLVSVYVFATCDCAETRASEKENEHYNGISQECRGDWTIGASINVDGTTKPSINASTHFSSGGCFVSYHWTPTRWLNVESSNGAQTKTVDKTFHGESFSGGGCELHNPFPWIEKFWTCKAGTTTQTDILSKWTEDC